jgi:hypothetical protein
MREYPVSVRRDSYRGANAAKQRKAAEYNRVASRVADYINSDLRDKPTDKIYTYLSAQIAQELGENSELVHEIVFSIDCGHNGVTIVKGDYDKAMDSPRGI